MASLHISINAEPIFYIGQTAVTNSMFTSFIVTLIILSLAFLINRSIDPTSKRPKGLQNLAEAFVEGFYGLVHGITHNAKASAVIFPLAATAFIYILINNWFGLMPWVATFGITEEPKQVQLPSLQARATETTTAQTDRLETEPLVETDHGIATTIGAEESQAETTEGSTQHSPTFIPIFRPATADLNATLALALITVGATQIIGLKFLGLSYLTKYFSLKGINTFVGFLELVSEISKIISFAFRLFGNIFAGEVLLAVIYSLIPVLVPLPFVGLEVFVGLIQALVFAMLTIVFMSLATHGHEEH